MKVLKFGGTSIGDATNIRRVGKIVASRASDPTVLVFSAMGSTTDRLVEVGELAAVGNADDSLKRVSDLQDHHRALVAELKAAWRIELAEMRGRLREMRVLLNDALQERAPDHDFSHLVRAAPPASLSSPALPAALTGPPTQLPSTPAPLPSSPARSPSTASRCTTSTPTSSSTPARPWR